VWATPRAARSEIIAVAGGALRVRLAAPPHEGRANAALIALVADALGVAPRAVELVRGASSRHKLLRVRDVSPAEARRRLQL
jgi:uncharacterized protein (TIGR00251 family)